MGLFLLKEDAGRWGLYSAIELPIKSHLAKKIVEIDFGLMSYDF